MFFSYGIKILTDFSSVLSQFTPLTDGQTDRRTDRSLIARPRLYSMQCGKNAKAITTRMFYSHKIRNRTLRAPEIRSFRQIVDWKSSSWTWTANIFSRLEVGRSWIAKQRCYTGSFWILHSISLSEIHVGWSSKFIEQVYVIKQHSLYMGYAVLSHSKLSFIGLHFVENSLCSREVDAPLRRWYLTELPSGEYI